jgi:hypothetical protein
MKNLGKIHLRTIKNKLPESELKFVVGGYDGSGTYGDPYQLPEVVIYADPCDALSSCGSTPEQQYCTGKRCGDECYNGSRWGKCVAFPGVPTCKICALYNP